MAPEDIRRLKKVDLDEVRQTLAESCREMRQMERVPLRDRLYGRSRMNGWPLWISWLLAGTPDSRRICRELMQLRKAGVDV